jgi:hypothetical protein
MAWWHGTNQGIPSSKNVSTKAIPRSEKSAPRKSTILSLPVETLRDLVFRGRILGQRNSTAAEVPQGRKMRSSASRYHPARRKGAQKMGGPVPSVSHDQPSNLADEPVFLGTRLT